MNLEWVALNACTEWDPKPIKLLAVVPKRNQQWHKHQWCIFLLSFDICFVFLSPKLAFIFDIDWHVIKLYIACHEVVGIHWHDSGWRKGGRCLWICLLDIMIQPFSKTHWSFNLFDWKWLVSKPKENIVGIKKKKLLSRWLASATFPLLNNIRSNCPFFYVCKNVSTYVK
jgi:hypothetical protein